MLDNLLLKKDDRSKIQTIGYVHSGLESFFMTVDRPVKYATKVIKSRRTHISNDIRALVQPFYPISIMLEFLKKLLKTYKKYCMHPLNAVMLKTQAS